MTREEKAAERRKELATLLFCRSYLYYNDVLTEKEAESIFKRIRAFQDKYKIVISAEQINSVDIKYQDCCAPEGTV